MPSDNSPAIGPSGRRDFFHGEGCQGCASRFIADAVATLCVSIHKTTLSRIESDSVPRMRTIGEGLRYRTRPRRVPDIRENSGRITFMTAVENRPSRRVRMRKRRHHRHKAIQSRALSARGPFPNPPPARPHRVPSREFRARSSVAIGEPANMAAIREDLPAILSLVRQARGPKPSRLYRSNGRQKMDRPLGRAVFGMAD